MSAQVSQPLEHTTQINCHFEPRLRPFGLVLPFQRVRNLTDCCVYRFCRTM